MKTRIFILHAIPIFGFFLYAFAWFIGHLFKGLLFQELNTWLKIVGSFSIGIITFAVIYGVGGHLIGQVDFGVMTETFDIVFFILSGIVFNVVAFKVLHKLAGNDIVL